MGGARLGKAHVAGRSIAKQSVGWAGWKKYSQGWEGEERTRTFEANRATLEETSKCEKQAAQSVRGPSAM